MAIQGVDGSPEGTSPTPAIRVSDAERQRATAHLKQACVEGRITLEEFGERVGWALAARTRGDLDALTADLPVLGTGAALAATDSGRRAISSTLALLSSVERNGSWQVAERSRVIAMMAACKLDLRHAAISAPLTTIRAQVVMGSLNVIVPEGVEVELDAMVVAGSQSRRISGPPPGPNAPVIRIEGFVLMGDLTVRSRP